MNRFYALVFGLVTVAAITGCDVGKQANKSVKLSSIAPPNEPRPFAADIDTSSLASKYRNVKPAEESRERLPATPPKIRPEPLPLAGIWISSGWMGDAAGSGSVLEYKTREDDGSGKPICDEWAYDPCQGGLGWCAVAYQTPENNWGDQKGKDLGGKGLTRLTFWAKGEKGGERVIFKSGGHTRANAQFPASYETSSGIVTLGKAWKRYSIPLSGLDLSNTPAAFVFVVTKQLDPPGCVFQIPDVAFRRPGD